MAVLTGAFDPNAQAQQDYSPLPTGEYVAQIVDSDMKPTKSNTGHYLELVYEITEGEHKGRKVWVRLNLDNPNANAVEIANRQFAAIREATGVPNLRTSEELHYRPHVIRVEFFAAGSKRGNGTRDRDENEVRAWKVLEGATQGAAPTAAVAPTTAAPWNRAA